VISGAAFVPAQHLLPLAQIARPALGSTVFPPEASTLAGATQPPFARFGAGFLTAVLPTFQPARVQTPFTTAVLGNPGLPNAPGENAFAASYAPEIYAVYVNGLIARQTVPSAALETNLYRVDVARPPLSGDPEPPLPGAPPVRPIPAVQQVIAALGPLAGSGTIFGSSAPAPQPAQAKTASSAKAA
jgi:hypothetical protein